MDTCMPKLMHLAQATQPTSSNSTPTEDGVVEGVEAMDEDVDIKEEVHISHSK